MMAIAFAIAYVLLKRIPKRFLSQYAVDSADEDEDAAPSAPGRRSAG